MDGWMDGCVPLVFSWAACVNGPPCCCSCRDIVAPVGSHDHTSQTPTQPHRRISWNGHVVLAALLTANDLGGTFRATGRKIFWIPLDLVNLFFAEHDNRSIKPLHGLFLWSMLTCLRRFLYLRLHLVVMVICVDCVARGAWRSCVNMSRHCVS